MLPCPVYAVLGLDPGPLAFEASTATEVLPLPHAHVPLLCSVELVT